MCRPQLPAVCGGEGFGQVRIVGDEVTKFKAGDWVVPARNMAGAWTSMFKADEIDLVKVPNTIDPALAATLKVSNGTLVGHFFVKIRLYSMMVNNWTLKVKSSGEITGRLEVPE